MCSSDLGPVDDRVERVDHSVAVAAERTLQNQRCVVESVLWYLRHVKKGTWIGQAALADGATSTGFHAPRRRQVSRAVQIRSSSSSVMTTS